MHTGGMERVAEVLGEAARELVERGFRATVAPAGDRPCLDVELGPAARGRGTGRRTHVLLQVPDSELPNLGVFLVYDRESDGQPVDSHRVPVFDQRHDRRLTYGVLPVVNRALNPVDPTGQGHSQHVGVYHGRSTVGDLLIVPWTAMRMFRSFRAQGQLAVIWTDFDAPLGRAGLPGRGPGGRPAGHPPLPAQPYPVHAVDPGAGRPTVENHRPVRRVRRRPGPGP